MQNLRDNLEGQVFVGKPVPYWSLQAEARRHPVGAGLLG
jgi:hypothetical protein